MYTINSYLNNMIISPFLWLLLHYKHVWWSNVRLEIVLLSGGVSLEEKLVAPLDMKMFR